MSMTWELGKFDTHRYIYPNQLHTIMDNRIAPMCKAMVIQLTKGEGY